MTFQVDEDLPYCPGCGHHQIVEGTAEACEDLGWPPNDVVLVTDIGCVGLADKHFPTHTIHGLHGRSPALATGIRFGLNNPEKHVIVYIGDGGATIGLQHLMESARLNVNMTVVVHDNMLYGMTGGQSSGLTPEGYSTTTEPSGSDTESYNLPKMVHEAGAGFSSRVMFNENLTEELREAFDHPGFSLIEVMEYCLSYGTKYNPDTKLQDVTEKQDRPTGRWVNEEVSEYRPKKKEDTESLMEELSDLEVDFSNDLDEPISILVGGSAGEGVQTAAKVLAKASMMAGLEVSKKGEYPVTVGSGFSSAQVIISPEDVKFTGIDRPDNLIITSSEGLEHSREEIESMEGGRLLVDDSLESPETDNPMEIKAFREKAGSKGAALCALAYLVDKTEFIPPKALVEAAETSKHAEALKESINKAKDL